MACNQDLRNADKMGIQAAVERRFGLFVFNFLGGFIGLNITVGWVSAIVAGVLGIPGIILLLLVENFFL